MYFLIRDDDTNYFTQPEELERSYGDIWGICPINLSVVPFHGCTKSGAIPKRYWTGEGVFPIGDNTNLIRYLKKKIREKKVYITLHGHSHVDQADGYEFQTGSGLHNKIKEGRKYLEQLFDVEIKWFVPPHNALSKRGWEAVVANGLNISGVYSPRVRGWHLCDIPNTARQQYWKKVRNLFYPYPIKVRNHTELHVHSLTPVTSISSLKLALHKVRRFDGYFCLASHYWELYEHINNNRDLTLKEIITGILEHLNKHDENFVCFSDIERICSGWRSAVAVL